MNRFTYEIAYTLIQGMLSAGSTYVVSGYTIFEAYEDYKTGDITIWIKTPEKYNCNTIVLEKIKENVYTMSWLPNRVLTSEECFNILRAVKELSDYEIYPNRNEVFSDWGHFLSKDNFEYILTI